MPSGIKNFNIWFQVAVLQPRDWQRIQNSLSRYNREAEKYESQKRDREKLYATSKELVKHWGNTIEVICTVFCFFYYQLPVASTRTGLFSLSSISDGNFSKKVINCLPLSSGCLISLLILRQFKQIN